MTRTPDNFSIRLRQLTHLRHELVNLTTMIGLLAAQANCATVDHKPSETTLSETDKKPDKRPTATHRLGLRVTRQEHMDLKQEAESYGYELSTLLRLRIFDKTRGARITPNADMTLLADIIGRLGQQSLQICDLLEATFMRRKKAQTTGEG